PQSLPGCVRLRRYRASAGGLVSGYSESRALGRHVTPTPGPISLVGVRFLAPLEPECFHHYGRIGAMDRSADRLARSGGLLCRTVRLACARGRGRNSELSRDSMERRERGTSHAHWHATRASASLPATVPPAARVRYGGRPHCFASIAFRCNGNGH